MFSDVPSLGQYVPWTMRLLTIHTLLGGRGRGGDGLVITAHALVYVCLAWVSPDSPQGSWGEPKFLRVAIVITHRLFAAQGSGHNGQGHIV